MAGPSVSSAQYEADTNLAGPSVSSAQYEADINLAGPSGSSAQYEADINLAGQQHKTTFHMDVANSLTSLSYEETEYKTV